MGKVIEHTSKLDDGDLAAIAEYLRALPALPARRGAASTRR
jgi:hypothetical protein